MRSAARGSKAVKSVVTLIRLIATPLRTNSAAQMTTAVRDALVTMPAHEAVWDCRVLHQQFTCVALKKRLLLDVVDLKAVEHMVTETPERGAFEWSTRRTLDHCATSQRERAQEHVHRRSDHLVEITGAGDLLA